MIKVQRGNVILNVKPEDKRYYLDKGYDIIDSDGTIIEKAIPRDIGSLRKLYLETKAELEKYKKMALDLKKENDKLKRKPKGAKD